MAKAKQKAKTLGDVAQHFGVSLTALQKWKAAGCPLGSAGSRDLEAIAKWREARKAAQQQQRDDAAVTGRSATEAKRAEVKLELERIELAKARGELVSLPLVTSLLARHIAEAKVHLSQGPDYLLSRLPSKAPAKFKRRYRAAVEKWIAKCCNSLTEAAESLARELSEQPPEAEADED